LFWQAGGKNQFFSPVARTILVPATRAAVMLSFDWLAFAVKLLWWAALL